MFKNLFGSGKNRYDRLDNSRGFNSNGGNIYTLNLKAINTDALSLEDRKIQRSKGVLNYDMCQLKHKK